MVLIFDKKEAEKRLNLPIRYLIHKWRIPPPLFIDEDKNVEYLVNMLIRYNRGCALVKNSNGDVVGIVTLFDLLKIFAPRRKHRLILRAPRILLDEEILVRDIMSRNPIMLHIDEHLSDLLDTMLRYEVSHITIIDDQGKPVAILSKRTVLKELLGVEKLVEVY